jgi:uncharacterized protein
MAVIDQELKDAIQKAGTLQLPYYIIKELKELGALVDDSFDETRMFRCKHYEQKYTTDYTSFTLIITYACNLACPYCSQGAGEALTEPMSGETADIIAKFIKKEVEKNCSSLMYIVLFGGEPLLNTEACFRILDSLQPWAKEKGIGLSVEVSSNGTLWNEELIDKFSNYDLVSTHIPFHGPREVHNRKRPFRDGSGTFGRLIDALIMLKRSSIQPYICINVDRESFDQVEELLTSLKKYGLQDIPIDIERISTEKVCLSSTLPKSSFACLSQSRAAAMSELLPILKRNGFRMQPQRRSYLHCSEVAYNHYTIDPFLDVYKCWHIVGLRDRRVGIISGDGKFEPEYRYFDLLSRDPLQIKECKDCVLLPLCCGGCFNRALFEFGTFHGPGCYGDEEQALREMIKETYRDIQNSCE